MKPRSTSQRWHQFPALILAGSIAASFVGLPAQAASTLTWSGATTNWNNNTNWVGSVLPASGVSLIFDVAGADGLTLNNDLTSGSFTVAAMTFSAFAGAYVIGDGTTTANAGNTWILGGTVTNNSSNLQTLNNPFTMTAARTFSANGVGADIALSGNISGSGGGITKSGLGLLTLSGTNSYTGTTQINAGVLLVNSANGLPGGTAATGGTSNLNLNGGVLGLGIADFTRPLNSTATSVQFGGNGGWAAYGADRVVNLGGASASVNWTTATTGFNSKTLILGALTATNMVDLQNPLDMLAVARTVQVDNGSAAIDAKLSGNITGIASGNLTKTGFGTLLLTGANNYVGTTTVSAGNLLVNGNHSGGGAFTVSAGAGLGGIGTISGAVTAAAGGTINLRDGAVGTLTLGSSLTFSGTAASPNNLYFDLGNGAGGTDKIVVAGAHTAATATGARVNFNQLAGTPLNPGTYTLIQGGAASNLSGYALATTRSGRNVYSNLVASANDLVVTVAAGDPGPANAFAYWQGDTAIWNTAQWYSDAGRTLTALPPGYSSNVHFATSSATNLTNTLGQDYEINSLTVDAGVAAANISGNMLTLGATADNSNPLGNGITVSNAAGTTLGSKVGLASSQTWTVDTAAALTVSGVVSDFGGGYTLTKAGAGTLTLSGINTFAGPLVVSGGTLAIGGAGQLGAGTYGGNIVNNGTFTYASTASTTLTGAITGTGSLTKSAAGTLTLNVGMTTSGGASLSGGTTTFTPSNLVNPLGSGTTTINATANLLCQATVFSNPVTMNGGTFTNTNSFSATINGPLTLAATSIFDTGGTGNISVNSNISGPGGLTRNGSGSATLTLTGINTYAGPTVVNGGNLILTKSSTLYNSDTSQWTPANITVASGGVLRVNVGGPSDFTGPQLSTLLGNLSTVNNNGLKAGAAQRLCTRGSCWVWLG